MNGLTILLWITIVIIGVIAIIAVKLHYKGAELEKNEESIIPTGKIEELISSDSKPLNNKTLYPNQYTQPKLNDDYDVSIVAKENYDYTDSKVEETNYKNIEYESQNQVLINYGNEVERFQEPMTESQVEIMTQDNEKHELKDLFTIDELIKESKRKDSEREKESQQISKDSEEDLTEIKESIRKRKENEDTEEKLIEEILADEEIGELLSNDDATKEETIEDIINIDESTPEVEEPKEETIADIINTQENVQETIEMEEPKEETIEDIINDTITPIKEEEPSVASQKDVAEAIDNASQEVEEEIETISETEDITYALLNSQEEIKQPTLKSPTKIDESKKEDVSSQIDDSNLYETDNDLDYRKDLAKITNTIKGSKLFQDVKGKIMGEPEEEIDPIADLEETYIRNVNEYETEFETEYDEYEPIINETHDEFGEVYEPEYDQDQAIREENTRRLLNNIQTAPEPEVAKPIVEPIKSKPSRGNIKIQLGNADVVLKKGDEIIFRHDGETYSSQVYAINGDDISVRYRRKNITIKPEDVKKVY